jgi:hypothetical protein
MPLLHLFTHSFIPPCPLSSIRPPFIPSLHLSLH